MRKSPEKNQSPKGEAKEPLREYAVYAADEIGAMFTEGEAKEEARLAAMRTGKDMLILRLTGRFKVSITLEKIFYGEKGEEP